MFKCDAISHPQFSMCTQGALYDLCLEHVNKNSSGIEAKDQETLDELLKACKDVWEDNNNRSGDAKTIFEHVVLAKEVSRQPLPVPYVKSSQVQNIISLCLFQVSQSQQQTPISAQRQQEEEPATNVLLCTSARSLESIFKSQADDYKARLLAEAEAQVEERRAVMIAEVEERRTAMIAEMKTKRATMMEKAEMDAATAMSVALKRREALFDEIEERRASMMAELEEEKKRKECGLDEPITIEQMVSEGPPEKRARKVGMILDMLKKAEPFTADEARPALRARVRWLMRLD